MASVERVGVRVFVVPRPTAAKFSEHSFGLELFADLSDGKRVGTREATTIGSPELPGSFDELASAIERVLSHDGLTARHRGSFWGPLVGALAGAGVHTDAETLMRLPFRTEPEPEVLALFD